MYNDGCNSCECNKDGTMGECTKRQCFTQGEPFCEKPVEPEEQCPSDCRVWYDGCNECTCDNGQLTRCTERACIRM